MPQTLPNAFADSLLAVLSRLLTQPGALPEDWEAEATTYDLPRFYAAPEFTRRLAIAVETMLKEDIQAPETLCNLLTECGHPYDYARLGQPLSTVYELYLQSLTGLPVAMSFASTSKPYLAVIEARQEPLKPVKLYAQGRLPLSEAKRQTLSQRHVELYEDWQGPIPASDALTVYISAGAYSEDLLEHAADALCFGVPEGGVLLIRRPERIDPSGIQLIRKRTVSALLASNAKAELRRIAGLPPAAQATGSQAECDQLLKQLFPDIKACAYFCTGLAAEAAVFGATAQMMDSERPLRLFFAQNGYGGTGQLISELLPRDGHVIPMPLQVLGRDAQGRPMTLVEHFIASLEALGEQPAALFIETPTNPELQVHDFAGLMQALHAPEARHGRRIPVLVDTTLAPLYPLFGQDATQNWPFLLVKSGSKYFTKGKATLGVVCCGDDPLARAILDQALADGRDADALAKSSQLAALSAGLADLRPRLQRIADNTRRLADGIRDALKAYGHDITLYAMHDEQVAAGLASGMLSFYLPPAETDYADLVDEFVDYLLSHAAELVKNRVSYGQSSGGALDPFYIINPQESTQGSLPEAVKAAQKRDNVQICRVSVPEHADVAGLLKVMERFFASKYA